MISFLGDRTWYVQFCETKVPGDRKCDAVTQKSNRLEASECKVTSYNIQGKCTEQYFLTMFDNSVKDKIWRLCGHVYKS